MAKLPEGQPTASEIVLVVVLVLETTDDADENEGNAGTSYYGTTP